MFIYLFPLISSLVLYCLNCNLELFLIKTVLLVLAITITLYSLSCKIANIYHLQPPPPPHKNPVLRIDSKLFIFSTDLLNHIIIFKFLSGYPCFATDNKKNVMSQNNFTASPRKNALLRHIRPPLSSSDYHHCNYRMGK